MPRKQMIFHVRALEDREGDSISLYGYIRGKITVPLHRVEGICTPFVLDARVDVSDLILYSDEAFLYGDLQTLAQTLRLGPERIPCLAHQLPGKYQAWIERTGKNPDTDYFFRVPLEALRPELPRGSEPYLNELLVASREYSFHFFENLYKITLEGRAPKSRSHAAAFRNFPSYFGDEAKRRGVFFQYYTTREAKLQQLIPIRLPGRARLNPVGGLPDWARDYMRKRRR